jgi:5'-deoxynucleotidase
MSQFKDENLATHCYETAVVGLTLGAISQQIFNQNVCPHKVASYCTMHESGEVSGLGDVNSPTKYFDAETADMFRKLERKFETKILHTLPVELQAFFEPLIMQDKSTDVHAQIAKAADVICAYVKCEYELQKGNNEFVKAMQGQEIALAKYREQMECVDYFCQHFLDKANDSFDDQIENSDWLQHTDSV